MKSSNPNNEKNTQKIIEKTDNDPWIGENLFNKYKIIEKLGKGSFGTVYKCVTNEGDEFAAKIVIFLYNKKIQEDLRNKSKASLKLDTYFLNELAGFGIPVLKTYGKIKDKESFVIIMEYLGPSLQVLFEKQNKKFSLKTTCLLGIQMIDRIEFLHSKKYIHRDIKPSNFLMGRGKKSHILYLCDFGISKKYWANHAHIKKKFIGKFSGTERFASVNSLEGNQQSRKDDLMSIAYVLILFLKGSLPWDDPILIDRNYDKVIRKIIKGKLEMKKSTEIEKLCKGLPKEILTFTQYINGLEFDEVPNYQKMKNYLKEAIINSKEKIDCKYDWCIEKPNIIEKDDIFIDHYNIDYDSNSWLNY